MFEMARLAIGAVPRVLVTALKSGVLATFGVHTQQIIGTPGPSDATTTIDGRQLPPPAQRFEGRIELKADQSKPAWPARVAPQRGSPNVLLIMVDDVGFGAPSP